MKRKLLAESLEEFRLLEQNEPLALAVLGAPAGGKSSSMGNIVSAVKDARIEDTVKSGVHLTVDVLRDELKSQKPREQLRGFANAFSSRPNVAINKPSLPIWCNAFSKITSAVSVGT